MKENMKITKSQRAFVAENLVIDSWESIQNYFEELANRPTNSKEEYVKWLHDKSELEAVLEEDAAWRYIKMTIDTRDEKLSNAYTFFVTKIQPELAPFEDRLNKKLVDSPYFESLNKEESYRIYFRSVKTALELFREENIPLEAELNEKSQLFGSISAAQSIEHNGETLTMQKAAALLKETDEALRRTIFEKMSTRRRMDTDSLDGLFTELIEKRHQLARNAGFDNFRDYKFLAMGRFDYTKEDCFAFHNAIKSQIVPLVKEIQLAKLNKLGKEKFKPWDLEVDPEGKQPLKPFETGKQLLTGTIAMFDKIDSYFGDCLRTMEEMGHLDLDSKEGKSPGGYNYPLYEIGVPFIFMNSVGAQRDLVTMVHEGGHAVHSFLSRDLELTGFKNVPSEVAELASMSMELLTMELWNQFYSDSDNFNRAKREQLESILKILPWIAQIDEFQHWIYSNPTHSVSERHAKWSQISKEYGTGLTDWSGFEDMQSTAWQRQLHLFEVPFYYIEYGIAQLGALGVWKNSQENFPKAIEDYKNALRLGYTATIPEIYKVAGISFDFTENYLKELAVFVQAELRKI
jgi:oligoendopeptidase F